MHTEGRPTVRVTAAKRDGRTAPAKLLAATKARLFEHVGGSPSIAQQMLIDRAAELNIRISALDCQFAATGTQKESDAATYLALVATLSVMLANLGPQAARAPIPSPAGDSFILGRSAAA
jgi:hypothetical protein